MLEHLTQRYLYGGSRCGGDWVKDHVNANGTINWVTGGVVRNLEDDGTGKVTKVSMLGIETDTKRVIQIDPEKRLILTDTPITGNWVASTSTTIKKNESNGIIWAGPKPRYFPQEFLALFHEEPFQVALTTLADAQERRESGVKHALETTATASTTIVPKRRKKANHIDVADGVVAVIG